MRLTKHKLAREKQAEVYKRVHCIFMWDNSRMSQPKGWVELEADIASVKKEEEEEMFWQSDKTKKKYFRLPKVANDGKINIRGKLME